MTHNHAIVWMDSREARVFRFNAADVESERLVAHNPFRKVHHSPQFRRSTGREGGVNTSEPA